MSETVKHPKTQLFIVLIIVATVSALLLVAAFAQQAFAPMSSATESADTQQTPQGQDLTKDDGTLPENTTVFDEQYPGISRLDPALLQALQEAATASGVSFEVNSGWRSQRYQEQLIADGVAQYGSAEEASRWIGTPTGSLHVSGHAVDLGWGASDWLAQHGADYGLCQTYQNEAWHYELRPEAQEQGCPAAYPDAAHDPRMDRSSLAPAR